MPKLSEKDSVCRLAFTASYSTEAVIQLERLDGKVARRIIKKIDSTLDNPRLFFKRLSGRREYKLRVGDYRVIADVDEEKKTILVRSLGHRRDIYEKH